MTDRDFVNTSHTACLWLLPKLHGRVKGLMVLYCLHVLLPIVENINPYSCFFLHDAVKC